MRRLFGPCGGATRQDVLAATDADANWKGEDFAARVVYRQTEKRKEKSDGVGAAKKEGERVRGDGQTPNGIGPKNGP